MKRFITRGYRFLTFELFAAIDLGMFDQIGDDLSHLSAVSSLERQIDPKRLDSRMQDHRLVVVPFSTH
jgi:hypothetical protein